MCSSQINSTLLSAIDSFLSSIHTSSTVYVAYSGGLDSTVLLHALSKQIRQGDYSHKLMALYVNHQLQAQSDDWAKHCAAQCELLGVPFQELKVNIEGTNRKGLEAVARQKRYQALQAYIEQHSEKSVLVTGHHQRDQVETFVLNMSRGAGLNGLAAMPYRKLLGQSITVEHVRPLLSVPYQLLVDYAQSNQLSFIEDPSNESLAHRRNVVRHKLLPVLETVRPGVQGNVYRAAQHAQEAQSLLDEYAKEELNRTSFNEQYIELQNLRDVSWSRQKNLIRYWFKITYPGIVLSAEHYSWILDSFKSYEQSQNKAFSYRLSQGELRLYKNRLYYLQKALTSFKFTYKDIIEFESVCSPVGEVNQKGYSFKYNILQHGGEVVLRSIRVADDVKRKKLKTFFQQNLIPPWERINWPVLADINGQIISVLGCAGCLQKCDENELIEVKVDHRKWLQWMHSE